MAGRNFSCKSHILGHHEQGGFTRVWVGLVQEGGVCYRRVSAGCNSVRWSMRRLLIRRCAMVLILRGMDVRGTVLGGDSSNGRRRDMTHKRHVSSVSAVGNFPGAARRRRMRQRHVAPAAVHPPCLLCSPVPWGNWTAAVVLDRSQSFVRWTPHERRLQIVLISYPSSLRDWP